MSDSKKTPSQRAKKKDGKYVVIAFLDASGPETEFDRRDDLDGCVATVDKLVGAGAYYGMGVRLAGQPLSRFAYVNGKVPGPALDERGKAEQRRPLFPELRAIVGRQRSLLGAT
jgi:hypothetical protein